MKKIILITIAVLFSAVGHAKYYKAIVYLVDGSPKTGFAELVEDNESKVYFRIDENAKTEKISSAEISKIVYTYESGQIITMEYLYLTGLNVFSGKYSKSKNK